MLRIVFVQSSINSNLGVGAVNVRSLSSNHQVDTLVRLNHINLDILDVNAMKTEGWLTGTP